MEKPEPKLRLRPEPKYIYSEQVEELALRAAEMTLFENLVDSCYNVKI